MTSVHPATPKAKVIVLTGPTGVGKTELSLLLAERLNGEIVSADSVQVYKHLDIGSDKLPASERRGIPHHLIDILDPLDPDAEYSAGDFHDAAHVAVSEIIARGAVPIVVGGTGFYLRTFMCGKPRGGKASPAIEHRVMELLQRALRAEAHLAPATVSVPTGAQVVAAGPGSAEENGVDTSVGSPWGGAGVAAWLRCATDAGAVAAEIAKATVEAVRHQEGQAAADAWEERLWRAGVDVLRRVGDPDGADRVVVERNNWYRLQRALEIVLTTGQPTAASAAAVEPGGVPHDFRAFFLHRPRLEVFKRIDERVEEMVLGGLLDEVHMLREAGAEPGATPATRAIGYRQALKWLQDVAQARRCDAAGIRHLASAIQAPTRRLQRSQLVFHRGDESFAWVDATGGPAAAAEEVLQRFGATAHVGGSDDFGRLSKQEKDAVKRYTTEWKFLDKKESVEQVLQWLADKAYIDLT